MVEGGGLGFLPEPVTGLVETEGVVVGPGGRRDTTKVVGLPKLSSSDQVLIQVYSISFRTKTLSGPMSPHILYCLWGRKKQRSMSRQYVLYKNGGGGWITDR